MELNQKISDDYTDVTVTETVEKDIRAFIRKYKINLDLDVRQLPADE